MVFVAREMRLHLLVIPLLAIALACKGATREADSASTQSASTSPVTITASDETDVSNYQAAGWRLAGVADSAGDTVFRFFPGFRRFSSGVLIFTLDTTLTRDRTGPPFDTHLADSIAIRGLGAFERFATDCRIGTTALDERIVGVVPDTVPERWMRPRVAWTIDTTVARIRELKPDSVLCKLRNNPDAP